MSTTTQVLFNSPALHSLKRDQLVKLCKIHSLKANGKNVELIQRLRQHAQTLPKGSPLNIAVRSETPPEVQEHKLDNEDEDCVSYRSTIPRPSEQWEVVMDSIAEVEENSQGTLSSQRTVNDNGTIGDFGMGSSRSTTVSSSIKALANSLGLKRNPSKSTPSTTASSRSDHVTEVNDELAQTSVPYTSLPPASSPPQTDHFVQNPPRMSLDKDIEIPLPGHVLRPGIPAPANARLSLGLGLGVPTTPTRQDQPTTTIRLVSNPFSNADFSYGAGENGTPQLQPFKTTFDLVLDSPTGSSTWPQRDVNELGSRRPSSTRVISSSRRSKVVIPGAFGSEEEEEDDSVRAGKRVRMDSEGQLSVLEGEQKKSEQEIRLEREHEAIRKKLTANRARRRSSAVHGGRKSGRRSTGRPSLLGKPKPKPSRFGFLSSAKSLVQSVWNRGKAPAPAIASNIPKPILTNAKPVASKAKMGPPPLAPKKKSSIAPAHSTTAVASGSRICSIRNANSKPDAKVEEEGRLAIPSNIGKGTSTSTSTSSSGSRSRSPLPSFSSRSSGNAAGVSSIGTRVSSTTSRTSSAGAVSSMGSKRTFGGASVASRTSSTGSSSRLPSITSRLFAPTASSLAKANGRPSSSAEGLKAVSEDHQHPPLGTITNSSSPNSRKIFSKPLLLPQPSGIPALVKNQRIASSDSTTLSRANSIQRSLTGRKPRISRSKVIARLASQRAANGNGNGLNATCGAKLMPRASNDTSGRTRSSLGAKVPRASYGGGTKSRASDEGKVLLSAKKRARQSEYARRKSKVDIAPLVLDGRSTAPVPSGMDVDG